ncbi:MAG: carbohydrate ABC transporter permease [Anaerolineae bacterium]
MVARWSHAPHRRMRLPYWIIGQAAAHALLVIASFIAFVPFVWMVFGSFKDFRELVSSPALLPHAWTLKNYVEIISRVGFVKAFANSAFQASTVTLCVLFTSAHLGFIFAKYDFPWKERIFTLFLSTMMVPFAVVLVPLYITVADLGLGDQLMGLVVTGVFSTFGIFMLRQFMESLPSEMLDATRVDGASEWRIFVQIVLPLSGAPIAALAIFTFLGQWDSFLWPLVVLSSADKQTLPLLLAGLQSLYSSRYDLWMAGAMLTVVPVMTIYAFASRYFIKGLAMTGLKG